MLSGSKGKVTINENVSFIDHAPGMLFLHGCKLAINQEKDNDVTICWHIIIVKYFYIDVFLLSSLATGLRLVSISWLVLELWQFLFINDWPETQKWKYPHMSFVQRLGQVRDTTFGTYVSIQKLLNTAECQGYSFYCFWVIKGKPTEG